MQSGLRRAVLLIGGAVLFVPGPIAAGAQAKSSGASYGCYVVTAEHLNIRARPLSGSAILDSAQRGEVLVKWRRFCALRGIWCPVQKGTAKGYADRSLLRSVPCSGAQSTPPKNRK